MLDILDRIAGSLRSAESELNTMRDYLRKMIGKPMLSPQNLNGLQAANINRSAQYSQDVIDAIARSMAKEWMDWNVEVEGAGQQQILSWAAYNIPLPTYVSLVANVFDRVKWLEIKQDKKERAVYFFTESLKVLHMRASAAEGSEKAALENCAQEVFSSFYLKDENEAWDEVESQLLTMAGDNFLPQVRAGRCEAESIREAAEMGQEVRDAPSGRKLIDD